MSEHDRLPDCAKLVGPRERDLRQHADKHRIGKLLLRHVFAVECTYVFLALLVGCSANLRDQYANVFWLVSVGG